MGKSFPAQRMKLPPGPTDLPLLQTIDAILHPTERLERCAKRYGDPFTTQLSGSTPSILFSDPGAMQAVFTADPQTFVTGEDNRFLRPLLGPNSLLLLDGASHERQRKLLMPPFHGERMRAYGETIRETTLEVLGRFKAGESFALRPAMQEITLRIILRTVFGLTEPGRFEALRRLLSEALDQLGSPLGTTFIFLPALQKDLGPWSPWGRTVRMQRQIDRLLIEQIREGRRANADGEDILSLLLAARDEIGQPMADEEIRDELLTLLFAGHETTATALTWAFYWIHALTEVRERLVCEIDSLGTAPDPAALNRLSYLGAVCSETLRIYPVGMFSFPRLLREPFELLGYRLEPGTRLMPCIYLTHHREELYPEPKRFRPERFLERPYSPYEYLPFGGGNRRCIGLAFALYEMKLAIAAALTHLHLDLADRHGPQPVRRGITLAPSGNLHLTVRERRSMPVRC